MKSERKSTNCDKLWRVWYGIFITGLHIFLVYVGIHRYLAFKSQAFDAKFGGDWNHAGMNFVLAMLISALVFLCLFLFTCFTRTANYANEGTQIGRDTDNLHLLTAANQSWRATVPLLHLNGSNSVYNTGGPGNGGLVQRSGFATGSDDDRISAVGGEEIMPGTNFDTWSGKSGANQDLMHQTGPNGARLLQSPTQAMTHQETLGYLSITRSLRILLHRFQRHFLPYANLLHLGAAYCLIFAIPIIQSQQIFHRALPLDYVWRSDLDILFEHESLKDGVSVSTATKQMVSESHAQAAYYSHWDNIRAISPEFFNLALVFLLLGLRYPSVFWYTSRAFSFVFSLLLLLTGLHILIEFNAASVLVKLACNRPLLTGTYIWVAKLRLVTIPFDNQLIKETNSRMTDTNSDRATSTVDDVNPLSCIGPLALSTTGTLIFLFSFLTIFEYGYRQFTEDLTTYRHYLVGSASVTGFGLAQNDPYMMNDALERRSNGPSPIYQTNATNESVHSVPNGSGKSNNCLAGPVVSAQLTNGTRPNRYYSYGADMLHPACRCCLHTYAPHISGLIGSLIVLAFKVPVMWDCVQVYRSSRNPLMLASPLSGIVVVCAWFIMWLAFSMKPSWKFQVNLPLQTITGNHLPMYPTMNVAMNGVAQPPIMMGSLLRHSGLGAERFTHPLLGPIHSPMMNQSNGVINSQQVPPYFTADDANGNPIPIPGSPIYACFHDQTPTYFGTVGGGSARPIRLPVNMDFGLPTNSSALVGLSNMGTGSRSMEYCSEDTEASSGRQSGGNNYVCLQSALNSTGHGILVPTDGASLMTRLLQATTPPPPPSALPTGPQSSQPPLPALPTSPQHTFHPGAIPTSRTAGSLVLPTPSSAHEVNEDDAGSSSTVQATCTLRTGMTSCSTYPSTSLGVMRHTLESTDKSRLYSPEGQQLDCSTSYGTGASAARNTTGLLTRFSTAASSRHSPNGIQLGPRVTFKDNVDTIANVSPNASDPGSQNTSSNDSGIDNLKPIDTKAPTPTNGHNTDSSGTYDNTFTPHTVRSSLVIRSPSQAVGHMTEEARSCTGTLPRSLAISTSTCPTNSNQAMNTSMYSTRLPTFGAHKQNSEQIPLLDTNNSELTNLLKSPGLGVMSPRVARPGEMIGDGGSSLQSSSTAEPYPLLLSSCLINDDTHEPRLCSQV